MTEKNKFIKNSGDLGSRFAGEIVKSISMIGSIFGFGVLAWCIYTFAQFAELASHLLSR